MTAKRNENKLMQVVAPQDANSTLVSRSEKEFRDLIESIPAMVFIALPGPSNAFVSRGWREYTGLSAEDTAGPGWQSVVHPEDLGRHMEKWRVCSATGEPYEDEARFRRAADGEYRWFLVRAVPLRDEHGNILKWYGILTDIEDRKQAEHALKRSEAYLAEAQRLSKTGSWAWDPRGDRMLYCSEEIYRIYGVDPQESVPSIGLLLQQVHPEDRNRVSAKSVNAYRDRLSAESVRGGRDKTELPTEFRLLLPDGTIRHVRSMRHPVLDGTGELVEVIGTIVDVTDRKRAEQALQRRESYWAEAQRLSHTGSFGWKPRTDERIWSEETFRIFQYDPTTKPTLEHVLQRVHPEDVAMVQETLERAARDGKDFDHEYRLVMPDGSIKYVHIVAHALSDESGDVEFVGAVTDVTAAKQMEQTLREREAYLAEAQRLTHTGSGAWTVPGFDALYLSDEWYRIYGFDPKHGLSAWKERLPRMHPEDRAKVEEIKNRAIREKSDYEVEHRIILSDGTLKYTHTVGHPVLNASGDVEQFVCTMMDVTERKRAEQAREALREAHADLARVSRATTMGELTASLSHELNQPIAAALTDATTLLCWLNRNEPDLEEARAAASRVAKDATRAAEIISRIRQVFKKGSSQRELVDLNEIIREMIALLRGETMQHLILVATDLAPDLPRVMADRVQLQQVMMNLMINGIEAMKDVEWARELAIKSRRAETDHVIVSVNDTGVGLPPQQREQIFNAFFTSKPQGTGMGLRISHSIIESHGGRLWAADNSPRGASFCFTLSTKGEAPE